ncbi:MAG: amidase domain-containing protein [Christensenellales bacterium]
MLLFKAVKKTTLLYYVSLIILALIIAFFISDILPATLQTISSDEDAKWRKIINTIFDLRNQAVLHSEFDRLETMYLVDERNGLWAYENEVRRSKYLSGWAEKQGCVILNISSDFIIKRVKQAGRGHSFYIVSSNEYAYSYINEPDTVNSFYLGTYHSLDLIPRGDGFIISREWYTDPLSCILDTEKLPEGISEKITSQPPKDISDINERRKAAVEYADKYCGAAFNASTGYNNKYSDYNSLGGDCANFVSQVLHEGGGFKKTSTWNYKSGKGSYSWIKAGGLRSFMLYSGRATLISNGKYADVYKHAYSLQPGDIIAYSKKGSVAHVAVVTGFDSKGYPLVNCHNADRYRVPWDIGWRYNGTIFYLISVHY